MPRPSREVYRKVYARPTPARWTMPDVTDVDAMTALRASTEMALVRDYAPWRMGAPEPNISAAIHAFCKDIADNPKGGRPQLLRAGVLLAGIYAARGVASDDAYLLMEHVHWRGALARKAAPELGPASLSIALSELRGERRVPDIESLSPEERAIWYEVARWETQPVDPLDDVRANADGIGRKVVKALDGPTLQGASEALGQALGAMQEVSELGTSDHPQLLGARRLGYRVDRIEQLQDLPLMVGDRLARPTLQTGPAAAAVEGAGTGLGGFVLTAADVSFLLTLNLRFIAEVGRCYGYETHAPEERALALRILGSSAAVEGLGEMAIAGAASFRSSARTCAREGAMHEMPSVLLQRIARGISIRLSRRAVARLIPLAGSVVASAMNYAYTRDNLRNAQMHYRKRRLLQRCAQTLPVAI